MTYQKRLYRSEDNKIFAGVCGGIGEYFDVDPMLIRILWLIFSFMAGWGVLLYIICWVLIPTKSSIAMTTEEVVHKNVQEIKDTVVETAHTVKEAIAPTPEDKPKKPVRKRSTSKKQ